MTANTWPTVTVEIAYGYGPFDAAPVWTTVPAADVLGASWTEGRQKGLEDFPPAQANVVLRNDDRRYDPEHTGGPHFGDLNPRTPVRFTATRSAVVYQQFTMYVEGGWEQSFRPPKVGTCSLQLIDLLGVIQGLPLPASPYDVEVLADDPALYFRFDEAQGDAVMHDSSGFERHGGWDEVALGAAPLVADGGTAAEFDHFGDFRGTYLGTQPVTAYPATVEAWIFVVPNVAIFQTIAQGTSRNGTARWRLSVPNNGGVVNPHGGLYVQTPYAGLLTEQGVTFGVHHVVWRSTFYADLDLFIDGQPAPTTIATSPGGTSDPWASDLYSISFGNTPNTLAGDFGVDGFMDNAAIYGTALSDARILAHYEAGATGWDGELTGARAARIAAVIGLPSGLLLFDDGSTTLGPADLGQGDALDYLRKLARTEQGGLFTASYDGGKIRFVSRYDRFTATRSTTSQATFTDDPAASNAVRYERGSLVVDPNGMASIINQASVKWEGGTEVVSVPSSYGPRGTSVDTIAPTAAVARSLGEWIVSLYSEPAARVRGLTIKPSGDPNAWTAALGLRIGDRVTLRRDPLDTGSPITSEFWIEGRTVSVDNGVGTWNVSYNLTPAIDPGWFIWGVSRWDVDTRWAY